MRNREEIIKALECCNTDGCDSCPYDDVGIHIQCIPTLLENALALIKELTEKNERLREKADRNLENLKAVLEERNENTTKADTVRKMQERLKERFSTETRYTKYSGAGVVMVIDQIAKEMLEGEK